ncbi:MAG: hypothetical protein ACFCD0_24680 [Gemmataceae bacterium]
MKLANLLFISGMGIVMAVSGCCPRSRCCTGRPAIIRSAPIAAPAPCPTCPQTPVPNAVVAPPPGTGNLPPIPPSPPGQI